MQGLKAVSTYAYFKSFMYRYEIVCFLETWTRPQNDLCNLLTDFECFILNEYRKGSRGNNNGRVSVNVKSNFLSRVKRINVTIASSLGIFKLLLGLTPTSDNAEDLSQYDLGC